MRRPGYMPHAQFAVPVPFLKSRFLEKQVDTLTAVLFFSRQRREAKFDIFLIRFFKARWRSHDAIIPSIQRFHYYRFG